jgi:peptidylprolyl isomerase
MPRKTLIKVFAVLAVLAMTFTTVTSCGGNNKMPSVTANAGEEPTITPPTGSAPSELKTEDIITGSGAEVQSTSTLTVHYTLMSWSSGEVLESSWSSGQPATFPLNGVIAGWQEGLPGAKVGGRRLLIIPPSLGYGPSVGHPLEKETLIFVVDIIAVS